MHPTAINKAIKTRRLASWKKNGQNYLAPADLDRMTDVGRRGSPHRFAEALAYRVGYEDEALLRLRYAGEKGPEEPDSKREPVVGELARWRRVGVLHGRQGKLRFFVLEPAPEAEELTLGALYIKGKFRTVEKVNNAKEARAAWEAFRPL